jgi:dipeptidyl aminopeptidase/acylaminoacyl peptidase
VARRSILAFCALVGSSAFAHAAPLEAYGKLPSIEQAAISPGGVYVALVVTDGDTRKIAIETAADRKVKIVTSAGQVKVRDIRWADDEHLIITASTTEESGAGLIGEARIEGPRQERYVAHDLDLRTGKIRGLLDFVRQGAEERNQIQAMNIALSLPVARIIDGKPAAFLIGEYFTRAAGRGSLGLFRVDLESGAAFLIERGGSEDYDWAVDAGGRPMAQTSYNAEAGVWKLMVKGSGGWRTVQTETAPIEAPALEGVGRDAGSVLVRTGGNLRELSVTTGTWGEPLAASGNDALIQDPVTGRLVGTYRLAGDDGAYAFFDAHDAAVWRAVAKAFPGDLVSLVSWSQDRKKIVVRVDSAEEGPAYSLVDLTSGDADWLGSEYAGLKAADISPVKPVRYKAADGLEITGYLTLPRSRDPHGLPLVVLPHGGPAARDLPGFDWWAQALASRGYAVLQPNYRGSTGFGEDFYQAGFGEIGRKMQTDLSDGVRDLARQGVVDPKRVCIVGASYGGYAALAGATLDRGVYRCAVAYGGPSDLRVLTADMGRTQGADAARFWARYIGARSDGDPVLAAVSPAAHAADVTLPVLLIHGRDDTVVPIGQSRKMADALRAAGKPVELVELAGEDHWLSNGATRLQMLQATVDFLEKNNPPH